METSGCFNYITERHKKSPPAKANSQADIFMKSVGRNLVLALRQIFSAHKTTDAYFMKTLNRPPPSGSLYIFFSFGFLQALMASKSAAEALRKFL